MFLPVHVALPHILNGKLKAIATSSPEQLPQLPDVPTLSQSSSDNSDMWYGVLAPKGTPSDIIKKLNHEIVKILDQPDIVNAFKSQGMVPAPSSPEEFSVLIVNDAKRWADVVKTGNIKAE